MNALVITLWAEQPLSLPLAYNQMVQGALYDNWHGAFPALHDKGYTDGTHTFRLFTFSPLLGHYQVRGKYIAFDGAIRLEVRSPVNELIEELANSLLARGSVRLGTHELPVINLESADRLMFFPDARIRMISPVTVHETTPDGSTVYYSPTDERFSLMLLNNLVSKLNAAGVQAAPILGCVPVPGTIHKRVSQFKGTYITAYEGAFDVQADPEALALLYYAGIGDRNSQGFGMFSIDALPICQKDGWL